MNIYLAPLEGITGYIYRNAQFKHFGGADKYFAPFITPSQKAVLSSKAKNDLMPKNNSNIRLIPQILTNDAKGFITMCEALESFGYNEFNLNLGCPSATVVSKGRGAGFLSHINELDSFLEKIYTSKYTISIKTRIGMTDPSEFYSLMEIYNKYPISELIIHPRTRQDMYTGCPNWDIYSYAVKNSKIRLCYNGNIFTPKDYEAFNESFPNNDTIMLGRGALINPALPIMLKNNSYVLTKEKLKEFLQDIYTGYSQILSGDTHLLYKMKELCIYIAELFKDNSKILKKIKRSKNIREFNSSVAQLFNNELILNQPQK